MIRAASAPGKVMWTGEYAVLDGHVAVVSSVSRRARALFGDTRSESPLIRHISRLVGERIGTKAAERAATIAVDSTALYDEERKLGLGSSSAVAAAAAALALGTDDPSSVLSLAFEAHGRAQAERGARGSGADIAAAVHGGLVAVRPAGVAPVDVVPLALPEDLHAVLVWTGQSADTARLVADVTRARAGSQSGECDRAIAAIAAASRQLIEALRANHPSACVEAIHRGAEAHAALAHATGVALVLPAHKTIRALAASRGGAAKPTGAGGGDIALAVFDARVAAERFREDVALAGLRALDVELAGPGVHVE